MSVRTTWISPMKKLRPKVNSMRRISLNLDPAMFDTKSASVKLSEKKNNGLAFDNDGAIYVVSSTLEPGNARNTPGNSVAGTLDQAIDTIRLNQNVSRKMEGDPTSGNEGVMIQSFVNSLLAYINGERFEEEDDKSSDDKKEDGDDKESEKKEGDDAS